MDYLSKIFDMWHLKLLIGSVFAIFSPFKVSIFILFLFIFLDTITACCYAIKIRKFTSRRFQKAVKKIAVYLTTVFVVRLLEIGIETLIKTSMVTNLILSFLIITEAVSIIENLTLLGLPLPAGFLKLILKNLSLNKFNDFFGKNLDKQLYSKEIEEVIQYQLPYINTQEIRELLRIELEEWKNLLNIIEIQTANYKSENNDLLFYRISSLIDITKKSLADKLKSEDINEKIISKYMNCHEKRILALVDGIKVICYSNEAFEKKINMIVENIIAFIYKVVADVQKGEISCKLGK